MHRLALLMIVRDEARCLARCLASARPWVDEMLVLDTGSVGLLARSAKVSTCFHGRCPLLPRRTACFDSPW